MRLITEIIPTQTPVLVTRPTHLFFKYLQSSLLVLLGLVFIPWLLYLVQSAALFGSVKCGLSSLTSGKFSKAATCARFAKRATLVLRPQTKFIIGSNQIFTALGLPLFASLDSANYLSEAILLSSQIGEGEYPLLTRLSETLGFLQASLQSVPRLQSFISQVVSARALVSRIQPLVSALPQLLAVNSKSLVLILIQDQTELRPTGGYLHLFALANLEGGRITDIQIYDTSSADTQLRGQVSPPVDLQRAIGESSWYLRDANWDPDFPTSASRIAWFVSKELSVQPDLVVSLNLATLVQLLDITGPVNSITSKNFYDQYFASLKSDPNSSQFLINLSQSLFSRLQSLTPSRLSQLLVIFLSSLYNRQIFIAPLSVSVPQLAIAGWSGGIALSACRSALPCLNNYLYAVDSNVGVNKANAFITRKAQVAAIITPGQISYTYRLALSNSSPDSTWPAGNYKNYLRVFLPPQIKNPAVLINNQPLSEYYVSSEHNLSAVGFLSNTAPGATTEIEATWFEELPTTSRFHYQLDLPNQPGVPPYPVAVTVTYPSGWFATTATVPTIASAGQLQYNLSLSRQIQIDVDFAKP